jgi:Ni/Co efflux regulator RcnB
MTKTVLAALAALLLGFGSSSFAQGTDRQDADESCNYARGPASNAPHCYPEWYRDRDGRNAGRIPPQYRNNNYVVEDWRSHRLNRPPRGYQWVQVGSDYVLVNRRTGAVEQILRNR